MKDTFGIINLLKDKSVNLTNKAINQFLYSIIISYNEYVNTGLKIKQFQIKKRNKKKRTLLKQPDSLKYILKTIHDTLSSFYKFKPSTIGFIKNASIYKSIKQISDDINKFGKNNTYILKIDMSNYFDSITKTIFKSIIKTNKLFNNIDNFILDSLIEIMFLTQDNLKQGFTTSPFISNIVGEYTVDLGIMAILKKLKINKKDIRYYRYADDLFIITKKKIEEQYIIDNLDNYIKIYTNKYDNTCKLIINKDKINSNSYKDFIKKTYKLLGVSIYNTKSLFTGTSYEQRMKQKIHKDIWIHSKIISPTTKGLIARYKDIVRNKKRIKKLDEYINKQKILYLINYNNKILKV